MLTCQRPFKKERNQPKKKSQIRVVTELEEWLFCGLEIVRKVGCRGWFSGGEAHCPVPCGWVLRWGLERERVPGGGSGLADIELFWVVECQESQLCGRAEGTWTRRQGASI